MQGLSLKQNQQQNLSPQQIQYIKLLQIPTAELAARIEEELEDNPALEEGLDHNVFICIRIFNSISSDAASSFPIPKNELKNPAMERNYSKVYHMALCLPGKPAHIIGR
mgnify:CR=1 FL=1